MEKYLVFVKLHPSKTEPFFNSLNALDKEPMEGVKVIATYNVFGNWDFAVWFEADSNDNALHFVGDMIRPMEGIIETSTMPTSLIKEYKM